MLLVPTRTIHKALDQSDMTWGQLVGLVDQTEHIHPMNGYGPERRVLMSGEWKIYAAEGTYDDEPCYYLLGLGKRQQADLPVKPVVGVETTTPMARKRGGAGTLMPTSLAEILKVIDRTEGWSWSHSGKRHIAVYGPNGARATLALTTSDWRSLRNVVGQLRDIGLDVKRQHKKAS